MGLGAMVEVLGSIELARHRYGFLWIFPIFVAASCGIMYAAKTHMTLWHILLIMIVTRVAILGSLWVYGKLAGPSRR